MKRIILIAPYSPYAEGDIINRDNEEAKNLVDLEIAKYFDKPVKNKMIGSPKKAKIIKKRK